MNQHNHLTSQLTQDNSINPIVNKEWGQRYLVPKKPHSKVHVLGNARRCPSVKDRINLENYDISEAKPVAPREQFCRICFPEILKELDREQNLAFVKRLTGEQQAKERRLDLIAKVHHFGLTHNFKPGWTILTCEKLFNIHTTLKELSVLKPISSDLATELKILQYQGTFKNNLNN